MSEKPLDLEKLAKVLQLTTSHDDHEALAAVRMANKMLVTRGLMWAAVLQPSPEPAPRRAAPRRPANASVEEMFRQVMNDSTVLDNDTAFSFLTSLYTQWHSWGRLSEKQLAALQKFYRNSVRHSF